MKNSLLFLITFAIIFSNCSVVKLNDLAIKTVDAKELIPLPIQNARGYLLINQKEYPNVDNWEIIMNQLDSVGDQSPNQLLKVQLEKRKNYWKVPREFLAGKRLVTMNVKGINSNGVPLVQTLNVFINDGDQFQPICSDCELLPVHCKWDCIGPGYAFSIEARKSNSGNKYYMTLEQNVIFDSVTNNATPYYYYVSGANINTIPCTPVNGNPGVCIHNDTGYPIIGPFNASQHPTRYCNVNGVPISSGTVYGIPKGLGPWDGNYLISDWIHDNPPCVDNLNSAMSIFNNSLHGVNFGARPKLFCGSTNCATVPTIVGSGGVSPNPCDDISIISGASFYDNLAAALGCLTQSYNPVTHEWEPGTWVGDTDTLELHQLDMKNSPIKLPVDDLFDEEGNPTGQNGNFQKGLYLIGMSKKDGSYAYVIKEIK